MDRSEDIQIVFRTIARETVRLTNNNQRPFHDGSLINLDFYSLNPRGNQPPPSKIYKIGDTGPAGGIIFYDKGEFSDGWRYMEVAPASTEFDAHWGAYRSEDNYHIDEAPGTRTMIGSGKRNTRIMIDYFCRWIKDDQYSAAKIVDNFNYGGYSDWFIPSKDELDLIYKNIVLLDVGGFSSEGYGTSSQIYDLEKSPLGAYSWYQWFAGGSQYGLESGLGGLYRLIRQF
jgi:hypothetical protein